jgi:hypothetical protein
MRALFLAASILAGAALLCTDAIAQTGELVGPGRDAPVGHFQPRGANFFPSSAANDSEQKRLSQFDEEQKKWDDELDRKLNICRGC